MPLESWRVLPAPGTYESHSARLQALQCYSTKLEDRRRQIAWYRTTGDRTRDLSTRCRCSANVPSVRSSLEQCAPGFYKVSNHSATGASACAECMRGGFCQGADLPPIALPGYGTLTNRWNVTSWREGWIVVFMQCSNSNSCPGPRCDCVGGKLNDGQRQQESMISQCGRGYRDGSPLCSECELPAYARISSRCERCSWPSQALYFMAALVGMMLIYQVTNYLCVAFESFEIVLLCTRSQ
jgi:hypothetical protein